MNVKFAYSSAETSRCTSLVFKDLMITKTIMIRASSSREQTTVTATTEPTTIPIGTSSLSSSSSSSLGSSVALGVFTVYREEYIYEYLAHLFTFPAGYINHVHYLLSHYSSATLLIHVLIHTISCQAYQLTQQQC